MYHTSFGPTTEFRVAGHSDIITVARMIFESYAPYIPIMGKIPPTIFEDFGDHIKHGNLWLLLYDQTIVGMVVLTPMDKHLLLQSMCVLPGYQGLGLGRSLLEFAELMAKACYKGSIKLYTNSLMERNQKIYRKFGYRETYRTPYDWGHRVHMEKKVSRSKKSRFQYPANAFC